MVKETGEPLTVNGEEVTAEKTFTAEEADGSIILEFTFDSSSLMFAIYNTLTNVPSTIYLVLIAYIMSSSRIILYHLLSTPYTR